MKGQADTFCLAVARIALSAWVGAAVLFVINGVRLVRSGAFDSVAQDHLALLRFPPYYVLGFTLVSVSLLAVIGVRRQAGTVAMGLVAAALVLMVADYAAVYRPLAAMITPAGQPRPANFTAYHRASMSINALHVGLCFVAAILLNRPYQSTDCEV